MVLEFEGSRRLFRPHTKQTAPTRTKFVTAEPPRTDETTLMTQVFQSVVLSLSPASDSFEVEYLMNAFRLTSDRALPFESGNFFFQQVLVWLLYIATRQKQSLKQLSTHSVSFMGLNSSASDCGQSIFVRFLKENDASPPGSQLCGWKKRHAAFVFSGGVYESVVRGALAVEQLICSWNAVAVETARAAASLKTLRADV